MRISDWSSDVCASDLDETDDHLCRLCAAAARRLGVEAADAQISAAIGARRADRKGLAGAIAQLGPVLCRARHRHSCHVRTDPGGPNEQPGREWCRGRGCKYEYNSVVAVA